MCGGLGCEHPSHLFDHRCCRHRDLEAVYPASRDSYGPAGSVCVTIQACARKTMGGVPAKASPSENASSASSQGKASATTAGNLSKGFCSHAYRRAANLNTEVSRETARKILAFARKHGALVVVFEDLKDFRPKARASIRRPTSSNASTPGSTANWFIRSKLLPRSKA